ncbi:carboxypeptidase-like regulatory domain-containing protein [Rhodococcus zopfii]|uniref:carboxypeptidase-like regulatory domain-containing protein n=1 Tax=Rhodococcus zopfii TaxID=43772 RepID=UPI00093328C3|nr:hypothetical protein [Rhodococcus zopfii]
MITIPVTATATTPPSIRALQIETDPHSSDYAVVVRPPHTGRFTLTLTLAPSRAWGPIPAGCAPESHVIDQVLNVEDQAPAGTAALTRSVMVCELGALDAGTQHTIMVPVSDQVSALSAAGSVFTANLHSGETFLDRADHPAAPVTRCAPPGRAPIRTADDQDPDNGAVAGAPETVSAAATGQIAGRTHPGARLSLTGVDACEDRIDRTVTATSDGQFRFAGLLPGRYALLDETGQVLCHLDVDADDPVVEDLTVTPMNRSL